MSLSSVRSIQCSGGALHAPAPSNRAWSTTGPMSSTATLRRSRLPAVLAWLIRMRNSHVRTDERPSKPSSPRSTPTQVSWTTSSATARLGT